MAPEVRSQNHWGKLGICDEKTLKEHIKSIFAKHEHQTDVLIDLYRMILPDWDSIEKIHGYPQVGRSLWKFICNQFIEFDRKYHPKVFKAGLWLNTGFSSNEHLDPWEISFDNCTVIMS